MKYENIKYMKSYYMHSYVKSLWLRLKYVIEKIEDRERTLKLLSDVSWEGRLSSQAVKSVEIHHCKL